MRTRLSLALGLATITLPAQAMAAKLPLLGGETNACTRMAWGYDPRLSEQSPYVGGYAAVVASLAKLAATGAPMEERYLSFQEYFGKPGTDPVRWGKPTAALLGALQPALGVLAGLNAVLPPAGQQVGHGGDGAPPQTGDLGAAEQNDIWLPAVV